MLCPSSSKILNRRMTKVLPNLHKQSQRKYFGVHGEWEALIARHVITLNQYAASIK